MRIGIDCRRGLDSGVGRVTQNLIEWMGNGDGSHEVALFTGHDGAWVERDGVERVATGITYHSADDFERFPRLVEDQKVDLFVATQYYVSPYVECPTVRFMHDLWPLLHPEWIPSADDFAARYGATCLRDVMAFSRRFVTSPDGRMLLDKHERVSRFLDDHAGHEIARYYAIMFLLGVTRAEIIVTPSLHSRGEIESFFPEVTGKIRHLPNGVSPAFRPANKLREDRILHVGNWEFRKNLEVLLEAFGLLRDSGRNTELVLVGNTGKTAYSGHVRKLIENHPHRAAITCMGLVDDVELVDLYQTSKVFVCPSLYEGFGIPSVEAMACGTPVISTRGSAVTEVCGEAALYFDPLDSASLVETLDRILEDGATRATMKDRGLERAARFSSDRIERILHDLIGEIGSLAERGILTRP